MIRYCIKCRGYELERQWCEHCGGTGLAPKPDGRSLRELIEEAYRKLGVERRGWRR